MSNYIVLSEYQDGNPIHIKKSAVSAIVVKNEFVSVLEVFKSYIPGLPYKTEDFTVVVGEGLYVRVSETPAEIARKLR